MAISTFWSPQAKQWYFSWYWLSRVANSYDTQGLSLSTVALIRIKYSDTKITNDTDWHICHGCAIWNLHDFKTQIMFYILYTSNNLNGYPWAVLPFPFNFVSKWDVSETRQGQAGLSLVIHDLSLPMKDQWSITSMIGTWWIFNQWWRTPKMVTGPQHHHFIRLIIPLTKYFNIFSIFSSESILKLVSKHKMKLC